MPRLILFFVITSVQLAQMGCEQRSGNEVAPSIAAHPAVVDRTALQARLESSMANAITFLLEHQDDDGAWRSSTYGVLRDGITLTPAILKTLTHAPPSPATTAAIENGAAYLRSWVRADGTIGRADAGPPDYPVYSASLAAIALARLPGAENAEAAAAWIAYLHTHQLNASLGWTPADPAHGGWGYSVLPPKRPSGDHRLPFDADLSSTLCAIGALRLSGLDAGDASIESALQFVERCQNLDNDGAVTHAAYDDGGFALTPGNDGQNKAGRAGIDPTGRVRYHSYGSATADGVRALIRCGAAPDDPRVLAARAWLERHFSATEHPGHFADARKDDRRAVYYYWCWSAGHAFRLLGLTSIARDDATIHWAVDLSEALLDRQGADGAWRNTSSFVKEDDPLVGTILALGAIGNCYEVLRGGPQD